MAKKSLKIIAQCGVFVFCALCFTLAFSADWLKLHFMNVGIEQILFHLRFPLIDKSTPYISNFCIEVLLPSLGLALLVIYLRKTLQIVLGAIICMASIYIVESKFEVLAYLEQRKIVSNLYENHYKKFDFTSTFTPKQNLIIIFAESLESTFSGANIPTKTNNQSGGGDLQDSQNLTYSPFGELIPNLTNIALKNINFSNTNALGGIIQNSNSVNTITGTLAYLCAIPLNMPFYRNDFIHEHFLHSAICVGDILYELGYEQMYVSGLDASFAGTKFLFASHKINVLDLPYFQAQNLHLTSKEGYWGIKDSELFNIAKERLETISKPFALYISTIDTHSGSLFVDEEHCSGAGYKSVISCGDKIISDFVKWVQNSHLGANTTIIILGDHLSHQQFFFPQNTKRFVYNAFINAKFTKNPTPHLTHNRKLTHFDITALILDSLGIRTESFGLGRNPLYGKTLLESEFSLEEFNALLWQKNNLYDGFWNIKKQ